MSWDGLIQIFNPGHQHLADELNSKRIEAQIPGSDGHDKRKTYVDLDRGIVHLALPPERFGSAWEPEPQAVEDTEE